MMKKQGVRVEENAALRMRRSLQMMQNGANNIRKKGNMMQQNALNSYVHVAMQKSKCCGGLLWMLLETASRRISVNRRADNKVSHQNLTKARAPDLGGVNLENDDANSESQCIYLHQKITSHITIITRSVVFYIALRGIWNGNRYIYIYIHMVCWCSLLKVMHSLFLGPTPWQLSWTNC